MDLLRTAPKLAILDGNGAGRADGRLDGMTGFLTMSAPPKEHKPSLDSPGTRSRSGWKWVGALLALGLILAGAGWLLRGSYTAWREARAVREALEAKSYDEALARVEHWLTLQPNSAEAHYLKGLTLLKREEPQSAVKELDQARTLGYPEPPLERLIGIIMARAGRADQAEPMLLRARERNPGPDPEVDEALAKVYLETYRFGAALEAIKRWGEAAPDDPKVYLWKAEVDTRIDGGPGALANDYREALKRDPNLDKARLGLAESLQGEGRHADAAAEYDVYLQRNPNDASAHAAAGRNALDAGREDEAIRQLDRALELAPENVEALDGRAAIALRRRDFAGALPLLDRAITLDPYNPELRYRRSLALDRLGRTQEARAERDESERLRGEFAEMDKIRKALVKTPNDLDLQYRAAKWLLEHGHEDEGLVWARRAQEAGGSHAPTARLLADYYERKGDLGLANFYRLQAGPAASSP